MESKNVIGYPLKDKDRVITPLKKCLFWLEQLVAGTHEGELQHALDYMIPTGTPIYAVQEGQVVWLRDDSKRGGPFKKHWYHGNRIVIKHAYDEYTAYEHLTYKGSKVKVGDRVKKGDLIGYSGRTGFGLFPHLHFELFIDPDDEESEGVTITPKFE